MKLIATGGYGQVYLDGNKAVKKISIDKIDSDNLLIEINTNVRFSHPNLIGFKSFYFNKRTLVIEMDYCKPDLSTFIDENGALSESKAFRLIEQLCDVVIFLHEGGFHHCDIRAENILIRGEHLYLCDHGCGSYNPIKESIYQGSIDTRGPEYLLNKFPDGGKRLKALSGKKNSRSSDLFQIGMTFFYMLTKTTIFYHTREYEVIPFDIIEEFYKDYKQCIIKRLNVPISDQGKNFLFALLNPKIDERHIPIKINREEGIDKNSLVFNSNVKSMDEGWVQFYVKVVKSINQIMNQYSEIRILFLFLDMSIRLYYLRNGNINVSDLNVCQTIASLFYGECNYSSNKRQKDKITIVIKDLKGLILRPNPFNTCASIGSFYKVMDSYGRGSSYFDLPTSRKLENHQLPSTINELIIMYVDYEK